MNVRIVEVRTLLKATAIHIAEIAFDTSTNEHIDNIVSVMYNKSNEVNELLEYCSLQERLDYLVKLNKSCHNKDNLLSAAIKKQSKRIIDRMNEILND